MPNKDFNKVQELSKIPLHLVLLTQGYSLLNMSLREMQRSKWIPLVKEDILKNKEKIMVNIKLDENKTPYYLYYNMNGDQSDRGNIINFAKNRKISAKKLVECFQNNKDFDFSKIKINTTITQSKDFSKEFKMLEESSLDNPLFENRMIYAKTITPYKQYIKEDKFKNVCFPHYSLQSLNEVKMIALCGFTRRLNIPILKDTEGNIRKKPLKNIQTGEKGIEILKPSGEIKNLVITESIIDSLSFVQLKGLNSEETLLFSTAGRFGEQKLKDMLDFMFEKNILNANLKINLAMDNDPDGKAMSSVIEKYFLEKTKKFPRVYTPFCKDVNDDLKLKNLMQVDILSKESFNEFLDRQILNYKSSGKTYTRNIILEKLRKIDKIKELPESFKNAFNQIPKHQAIKTL